MFARPHARSSAAKTATRPRASFPQCHLTSDGSACRVL